MTPKFENFTEQILIQEIKINLENSFKWHSLTPKEIKELYPNRCYEFYKVFKFMVNNYEYHVISMNNSQLHFLNYTIASANQDDEKLTEKDLDILDNSSNVMQLIATIFDIMKFLSNKLNHFVIVPPKTNEKNRAKIYLRLLESNYKSFLPDFELKVRDNKILLFRANPHKDVGGLGINEKYNTRIENCLNNQVTDVVFN